MPQGNGSGQRSSTLTGIFNTVYVSGLSPQVLSYTGTYNSSTGSFTLTSSSEPIQAELSLTANPNSLATGTFDYSPPAVCGIPCEIEQSAPAVGVQIAPLNGTYTGTLTASPNLSGTASLTFTQSSTPNSSGQFPLTSMLTFTGSGCSNTASNPGTVSGIGITLQPVAVSGVEPVVTLNGYTNPTATQITLSALVITPGVATNGSCSSTYTGTLTLQQ